MEIVIVILIKITVNVILPYLLELLFIYNLLGILSI